MSNDELRDEREGILKWLFDVAFGRSDDDDDETGGTIHRLGTLRRLNNQPPKSANAFIMSKSTAIENDEATTTRCSFKKPSSEIIRGTSTRNEWQQWG
jgi:hypothetical protein